MSDAKFPVLPFFRLMSPPEAMVSVRGSSSAESLANKYSKLSGTQQLQKKPLSLLVRLTSFTNPSGALVGLLLSSRFADAGTIHGSKKKSV